MHRTAPLCAARLLAAALPLAGCAAMPPPDAALADLVLHGGRVVTVDPALGDASALAVAGDRIVAVGSYDDVADLVGADTRVIDLDGMLAVPGFIEGHGHFTGIGEARQILDLRGARTWDEVVAQVAAAVGEAEPGEWILGRGWHQEKWDAPPADVVEGFPTHASLSAVSPANPVSLKHASGHACFFNARAMALAGVDAATPDPPGGEVLRLADGAPSGVFRETAQALVARAHEEQLASRTPDEVADDLRRAIRLADRECLSKGVTSFQDAGSDLETIEVLHAMAAAGELGTRLWVMIRDSNERLAERLATARCVGVGRHHLTVRAVKRTLDGALGSRGAWLLEPYADSPASTGLATASVASVERTAELAAEHDYQLCAHAIGDRANREVLDLFERVLGAHGKLGGDHRWRVEHAQHVHPDDVPRFAELGVVASMQAVHCTSDAPFVEARLGPERARSGAYLWRALIDSGALVTNGTDAPVEDVDPLASFHAAVTRRLADGSTFHADQRMTRREALEAYTVNGARAAFEEDLKGTLTPGKLADVVVLSKDVLTVPADEIPDAEVVYTIVGGEVLYERGAR